MYKCVHLQEQLCSDFAPEFSWRSKPCMTVFLNFAFRPNIFNIYMLSARAATSWNFVGRRNECNLLYPITKKPMRAFTTFLKIFWRAISRLPPPGCRLLLARFGNLLQIKANSSTPETFSWSPAYFCPAFCCEMFPWKDQARRQDFAAGGGQKSQEGTTFLNTIFNVCRPAGRPNLKWGGGHHWTPR